ncbi:MAG TPA: hypothetical protein VF001_08710 [Candidatus Limnocylindria bacterium]
MLRRGHTVHAAADGASGIAQLDCKPDVIVLARDAADGWAGSSCAGCAEVAGHEHAVLLLTGTASSGASLAGVQPILRKPLVVEALLRQVAYLPS